MESEAVETVGCSQCQRLLRLQSLTAALLPAAVVLDQRCFGGLWTVAGYQRELDSPNSEIQVLLFPDAAGSAPSVPRLLGLGCYWAILEEAHITLLAIDPLHQRQGLGQALLYSLLASAQQRGLERATLEVRSSNQAALSLYQRFGFKLAGCRKRYYPDTQEDALVLWLGGLHSPQFQQQLAVWQQQVDDRLREFDWQLLIDLPPVSSKDMDLTCS